MKRRRQMTTTMTTKTRIRTTIQHDEPRSSPAMWTPNVLPVGRNCKSRANSASPSADCKGHYQVSPEPTRGYSFLSTRVLPHHPPLAGSSKDTHVAPGGNTRAASPSHSSILTHYDKDQRRQKDRDLSKTRSSGSLNSVATDSDLLVTSTLCTPQDLCAPIALSSQSDRRNAVHFGNASRPNYSSSP